MGSVALAGAALIVGAVLGWLLRPRASSDVLPDVSKDALPSSADAAARQAAREHDGLAAERKRLDAERAGLAASNAALESERKRLATEQQSVATEREKVAAEAQKLAAELDEVHRRGEEIGERSKEIAAEREQLEAARRELTRLRQELDSRRDEAARLGEAAAVAGEGFGREREQLLAGREQLTADADRLSAEREQLEATRDELARRESELAAAALRHHEEFAQREEAIASAQETLRGQQSEIAADREQLETRRAEVAALQEALERFREEVARDRQAVEHQQQELARGLEELAAIREASNREQPAPEPASAARTLPSEEPGPDRRRVERGERDRRRSVQPADNAPAVAGHKVEAPRSERDTTVLVCDVGSASGDEQVPANVLRCLTDLQKVLAGIVGDEGGTIDRFAGNRLIALFVPRRRSPDHAGRALEAAERIASNVDALSRRLQYDLRIGVGLHSGTLPVDFEGHLDSSAIGDAVDVASRLEALATEAKVTVVLTEAVLEHAEREEEEFDPLGETPLGTGASTRVFAVRPRAGAVQLNLIRGE